MSACLDQGRKKAGDRSKTDRSFDQSRQQSVENNAATILIKLTRASATWLTQGTVKYVPTPTKVHVLPRFNPLPPVNELYATAAQESLPLGRDMGSKVRRSFVDIRDPWSKVRRSFIDLRDPRSEVRRSFVDSRDPSSDVRRSFVSLRDPWSKVRRSFAGLRDPRSKVRKSFVSLRDGCSKVRRSFIVLVYTCSKVRREFGGCLKKVVQKPFVNI